MRLKRYLIESAIQDALDLPEPTVGGRYSEEQVKKYLDLIEKAIKEVGKKEDNEANAAILNDLEDKKEKWSNVEKETKPVKTKQEPPPEDKEKDGEEELPSEEPEEPEEEPPPEDDDEEEKDKKKKKKGNK